MPSNIEVKAALRDPAAAEAIAARLSGGGPEILRQDDLFFRSPGARLKLRILGPHRGELIRYERADIAGLRASRYEIARTEDPDRLLNILTAALEQVGRVKKTRQLYLVGQTRIHIDAVEGLGNFLELEVVLQPGQSEAEGRQIATGLLDQFGISQDDVLAGAYVDLLGARQPH